MKAAKQSESRRRASIYAKCSKREEKQGLVMRPCFSFKWHHFPVRTKTPNVPVARIGNVKATSG